MTERPHEQLHARELTARAYEPNPPRTLCLVHAHLTVTDRPRTCLNCRLDLENAYRELAAAHEWLNRWRDDALAVLERQDEALLSLQGWTARETDSGPYKGLYDIVRGNEDEPEWLVRRLMPDEARRLETWLNLLAEYADGLTTQEGGKQHGHRQAQA